MSHKSPGDGAQLYRCNYSLKSTCAHTHKLKGNTSFFVHAIMTWKAVFPNTHTHKETQLGNIRHVPTNTNVISEGFSVHLWPSRSLCILISAQKLLLFAQHKQRFKTAQLYTEHQKCQTQRVEKKPMLITAAAEQTLFICRDLQCTNCTDGPCRASWG